MTLFQERFREVLELLAQSVVGNYGDTTTFSPERTHLLIELAPHVAMCSSHAEEDVDLILAARVQANVGSALSNFGAPTQARVVLHGALATWATCFSHGLDRSIDVEFQRLALLRLVDVEIAVEDAQQARTFLDPLLAMAPTGSAETQDILMCSNIRDRERAVQILEIGASPEDPDPSRVLALASSLLEEAASSVQQIAAAAGLAEQGHTSEARAMLESGLSAARVEAGPHHPELVWTLRLAIDVARALEDRSLETALATEVLAVLRASGTTDESAYLKVRDDVEAVLRNSGERST